MKDKKFIETAPEVNILPVKEPANFKPPKVDIRKFITSRCSLGQRMGR